MDEQRPKVVMALVPLIAIQYVMALVVILQKLTLHQHYGAIAMVKECGACFPKKMIICAMPYYFLSLSHLYNNFRLDILLRNHITFFKNKLGTCNSLHSCLKTFKVLS